MTGPPWTRWVLAAALGVVTVYCLARLVVALWLRFRGACARTDVHVDVALVLAGGGMTAMFVTAPGVLPPLWWAVLFAADAVWLGFLAVRSFRDGGVSPGAAQESPGPEGYLHHVVANLAMLYMFAAPQVAVAASVSQTASPTGAFGHSHGGHTAGPAAAEAVNTVGLAFPLLAWLLMLYSLLSAGWCGAHLVRCWTQQTSTAGDPGTGAFRVLQTSHLASVAEFVMALGMAYMLFVML